MIITREEQPLNMKKKSVECDRYKHTSLTIRIFGQTAYLLEVSSIHGIPTTIISPEINALSLKLELVLAMTLSY